MGNSPMPVSQPESVVGSHGATVAPDWQMEEAIRLSLLVDDVGPKPAPQPDEHEDVGPKPAPRPDEVPEVSSEDVGPKPAPQPESIMGSHGATVASDWAITDENVQMEEAVRLSLLIDDVGPKPAPQPDEHEDVGPKPAPRPDEVPEVSSEDVGPKPAPQPERNVGSHSVSVAHDWAIADEDAQMEEALRLSLLIDNVGPKPVPRPEHVSSVVPAEFLLSEDAEDLELKEAKRLSEEEHRARIANEVTKFKNLATKNLAGTTALHFAARAGSAQGVKAILDERMDVNATNRGGQTALHFAAESNSIAAIRVLLENRADVCAKAAEFSQTPFQLAEANHKFDAARVLGQAVEAGRRGGA